MEKIRCPGIIDEDYLATLANCEGYYSCPKDTQGKRLGPLVGYAGKYLAGDGTEKNFVGDEYFNFSKAEQWPSVRFHFAGVLMNRILDRVEPDIIIGMPMGGIMLAASLAHVNFRSIFAEKEVVALADPENGKKEESRIVIARHDIFLGDKAVILEDVLNNFSTTQKAIDLIQTGGGKVVAIASFLNRSDRTDFNGIPIISLVHRPSKQWRQEDPEVADDIAKGNIVWKPKKEWQKLKIMRP